jgi:hypothetical protein
MRGRGIVVSNLLEGIIATFILVRYKLTNLNTNTFLILSIRNPNLTRKGENAR